jgi:hypothetical protein
MVVQAQASLLLRIDLLPSPQFPDSEIEGVGVGRAANVLSASSRAANNSGGGGGGGSSSKQQQQK